MSRYSPKSKHKKKILHNDNGGFLYRVEKIGNAKRDLINSECSECAKIKHENSRRELLRTEFTKGYRQRIKAGNFERIPENLMPLPLCREHQHSIKRRFGSGITRRQWKNNRKAIKDHQYNKNMDIYNLTEALISSVDATTAYNAEEWQKKKDICPLSEHCFAVAYVVKEILGGQIVCGIINGERHAWNQLEDGEYIDLTSKQFGGDGLHPIKGTTSKPWKTPKNVNKRFTILLERVKEKLK